MTKSSTPLADRVREKSAPGSTSYWDIAAGQSSSQSETPVPVPGSVAIPKAKALNPTRDVIVQAERYLDNVLTSPTAGEFNARAPICEEAMATVDQEISALESRMHVAWDFIDTLPDGDEKERSIDRFLLWEEGYRVAYDFVAGARQQMSVLRDRLAA